MSTAVFADEHADKALVHADAAVTHGKAGHAPILVDHAKQALDHTLAASIAAKGQRPITVKKTIDEGNLGHLKPATKAAEEAVEHIKASNK